jgi:hypothetical protein
LIFLKKKSKPNRNRFKPIGFGSVILEQKPIQTGLARFSQFGLVCFLFGSVFLDLRSVWFGFFSFRLIKPKPNWSVFSKF